MALAYQTSGRQSAWRPVVTPGLVVLILAVATAVRCHGVGTRNLWADEYLSLECSAGWGRSDLRVVDTYAAAPDLVGLANARPITEVWRSIARDENHPPGYFLLLRVWRDLFGDSAAALRSLSVVASVAAVGLTMAAGAELGGTACGLWAGLLMAVASPQIREAQDARAYMPVAALSAAAVLLLARIARRGPTVGRAVGLGTVLLLLPMLHYMALATVGAAAVFVLVGLGGRARHAAAWAVAGAVAVYVALWGPAFIAQRTRMLDATKWLADPDAAGRGWRTLSDLAAVPIRLLVDPGTKLGSGLAVGGLAALALPPLALVAAGRTRESNWRVLLLWVWLIVPVATAFVVDLSSHRHSLRLPKYTLAGGPALCLLAAVMAASGRRLAWVPAAAVAAAALLCLPAVYEPDQPDWRPMARFVLDHTAPGDPVVLIAEQGRDRFTDGSSGVRLAAMSYWLVGPDHRDLYVLTANRPAAGPALAALRRASHAGLIGSAISAADDRWLTGLVVDHVELAFGLGVVATADRPAHLATGAGQPPVVLGR